MIELLRRLAPQTAELLGIPMVERYLPKIDLSIQNLKETTTKIYERDTLFGFVEAKKMQYRTEIVWGGYLEQRLIYASSSVFHQESRPRNIHLGLDFWADAGLGVFSPLEGLVHSFQDNALFRDYGPTIILQHRFEGQVFHSLYGHLSRQSLDGLAIGQSIAKGQALGFIGEEEENGQWPPHLHFQLIIDMEGKIGDYPGVCAVEAIAHYQANCPDPRFLLGI